VARLFVSHSSVNNAAAVALGKWLSEQGFDDVFLDIDPDRGLVPGERWQEALKVATDRCEAVLFLVSPSWLASRWCLAEFLLAKSLHKRIFGLIIEPVPIERLPPEMTAEWQLCELVGEDRFRTFDVEVGAQRQQITFREAGLDLLRRGLERAGLDARSFPWPPPDQPNREPYRGLRPLEAQDAAIFFGRDAAIVRGLDRIRGLVEGGVEKLLVVLGASGSGKSSFLRAGLWPRLARDDTAFLPLPVIRPETAVINGSSGLAVALSGAFQRLGDHRSRGRINQALAEGADGFGRLLDDLSALAKQRLAGIDRTPADPVIVISIDQAEELFNVDGAAEVATFVELLASVLKPSRAAPARRILVIATIRSDRYELLQSQPYLADVKRDLFDLSPIPPSEFKSVIEGPARRVVEAGGRLAIDPALTEQLIADAEGADALPLLGFTLERLHADYGSEGQLTLAEYEMIGGVQGSIEAAVARALADPQRSPTIPATKEEQLACLRAAFIPWLARIEPETAAPMRRLARLDEIPLGSRAMVERLVAARLLVADRRAGADVIEVAHESLLRRWPALTAWLEADADDLKLVEGVERAAGEWARNGRHDAWLDHRAERLSAADRLAGRDDFSRRLGEQGLAYLAACKLREDAERKEKEEALAREQARLAEIAAAQARTARLQRNARWILGALAVAVAIGLGAGGWLYKINRTQELENRTQKLELDRGRINLLAELAATQQLRDKWESALRFAAHAVRLDLALGEEASKASPAAAALAAAVSQAGWRLMLSGHDFLVSSALFSRDGARIVTASWDRTARIWDAATGRQITVIGGHADVVRFAAFSPDGARIVTASRDKTARVWDAETGAEIAVLHGHEDDVLSAGFNADGTQVLTSSLDGTARIWDAAQGKEILILRGHQGPVWSAAFSPDGSRIVTASDDATVRIWDAVIGNEIAILHGHTEGMRFAFAAFSPDGSRIVSASFDNTASVWDATTGVELMVLRGHEGWVNGAVFSPDGSRIVTASGDQTARIWDSATGKETAILRGHENSVLFADFSPDGARVVTASYDNSVRVWDTTGNEIMVFRGHEDQIQSASFSFDGSQVVTASYDMTARIWDAATAAEVAVLSGHEAEVNFAAFSPDGSRIVTASGDQTARIWDSATGAKIAILRGHEDQVFAAAFSPSGARVVTASADQTARIWDTAGTQLAVLRGHQDQVQSAAFSPDGSRIVTAAYDNTAIVWDATTGKEIVVLRGHEAEANAAAFSPDGSRIVTASLDQTARIWDAATGREIAVLRGHDAAVRSAAFSPDGSRIVTAAVDRTARIWDAATGKEILVLRGHEAAVIGAAFSPDATRIVTASQDQTARLWDVRFLAMSAENLLVETCGRRLGRLSKLSREEMRLAGYPDNAPEIDVCAEESK
jgi:WD40 repeat protein